MRYRMCVLPGIVALLWQATLWAQALVYERFENSTQRHSPRPRHVRRGRCGLGWSEPSRIGMRRPSTVSRERAWIWERTRRVTSSDFTVEAFVKLAERSDYAAIAADWNEDGDQRSWALVCHTARRTAFRCVTRRRLSRRQQAGDALRG